VKISKGQIEDSYGIFDKRQDILFNPNPNITFEWFRKDGTKKCFRDSKSLKLSPKSFDEQNFNDVIDFSETELQELDILIDKNISENWIDISN
jgi:hypothetical protein